MAFERATSPALRWVAVFLAGCAVLGLTLGFRDQIRRNPPAWYTGAQEKAVAGGGLIDAQEAVAFDPQAPKPTLQTEAPKPKVESEESKAAEAEDAPATPAPAEKAPEPPAAPKARPPAPKIEPPSEDPVGDLLEGQKKAPETAPTVPY